MKVFHVHFLYFLIIIYITILKKNGGLLFGWYKTVLMDSVFSNCYNELK